MQLTLFKKLSEVNSFVIYNNYLVVLNKLNEVVFYDATSLQEITSMDLYMVDIYPVSIVGISFNVLDDRLFLKSGGSTLWEVFYDDELIVLSLGRVNTGVNGIETFNHEFILTRDSSDYKNIRSSLKRLGDEQAIWTKDIRVLNAFITDKVLFVYHTDNINEEGGYVSRLNIKTGNIEWTYLEKVTVRTFLGLIEHVLIVKTKEYTTGLDINTGKELWRRQYINCLNNESKLVRIISSFYQEFDPVTGSEICTLKNITSDDEIFIYRQLPRFYKNYIVSTGGNHVGVFNVTTLSWETYYKLTSYTKGADHFSAIYGNKFFVNDIANKLWIFELNEDSDDLIVTN